MKQYDLIVVGTGSGGLSIGLAVHAIGLRVLFIEKDEQNIGGECLHTGCIPSKALLHVARQVQQAREAHTFGLNDAGKPDFGRVMQYVQERIAKISAHENADYFRKLGVDIVIGTARFVDKKTLEAAGERFTAKRIVLATGSQPVKLDVPGIEQVRWYDNQTIFSIETLPERLLVVGGGPIAMELGQAFSRLGAQVTVVQSGERILAKEIPGVSALLQRRLEAEGMQFRLNARVTGFPAPDRATVTASDGSASELAFDAVLVAIGRQINVEALNPGAAGIETDKGKLKLDDRLQTTNPAVFAIGDVTDGLFFSHTPEMQAPLLVTNFLSPIKKKVSYKHFSWVTFTDPQVATFGQTPDELEKEGIDFERIEHDFSKDDRAITDNYQYGKLWLYLSKGHWLFGKRKLLGGTVVAPHAGEMIQDLILANTLGLGASALRQKIYPYPVASRVTKTALFDLLQRDVPQWVRPILQWLY